MLICVAREMKKIAFHGQFYVLCLPAKDNFLKLRTNNKIKSL